MGFPIRKSSDQSSFAAPQGLSQRTTSFIASQRQGIHRTPLLHLITLMIDARLPANTIERPLTAGTPAPVGRTRRTNEATAGPSRAPRWRAASRSLSSRCQTPASHRPQRGRTDANLSNRTGPRHKTRAIARTWWSQTGSNRRPPACKAGALPIELWPQRKTPAANRPDHGGPGTTRTSDLTLIRGAL